MKTIDWQMAHAAQAVSEILRSVKRPHEIAMPQSSRPLVGPVLNLLRRCLERLAGSRQLVAQQYDDFLKVLSRVETSLSQASQRAPGPSFHIRENTNDWDIFRETNLENHYRLPERLGADDVVIDIGMHIGSFAFAALARGAGRVYGFEVDEANFAVAEQNLKPFGDRARIFRKAAWRSDRKGDVLRMPRHEPGNMGGGSFIRDSDGPVLDTVALDDVIEEATEGGRKRITMLKIDCEGSEYPILLTAKKLSLIDRIHGEYHEINNGGSTIGAVPAVAQVAGHERFTVDTIVAGLRQADFDTEWQRSGDHLGLFFATQRQAQLAAA